MVTVAMKSTSAVGRSDSSRRLAELRKEAVSVRAKMQKGKISTEEALDQLTNLAKRNRSFVNKIIDLD